MKVNNFHCIGITEASGEVSDGGAETTYVAMQTQDPHVEEAISAIESTDDVC